MSTTLETYTARVTVRLRASVNDPQGTTVLGGLQELGFDRVREVRVGKTLDITLVAEDVGSARRSIDAMCEQLLANPVIETFDVEVTTPQPLTMSNTAW